MAPATADRLAAPARVRLAVTDADADAAVVAVGVDGRGKRVGGRGEREVPREVDTVGGYRSGPGSDAGSAVPSGHVDDRVQSRGAFHGLGDRTTRNHRDNVVVTADPVG